MFVWYAPALGVVRRRSAFVHVSVSSPFINRFSCSFLRFSEHETAFLTACINLNFVVRWRHNFGGNLQKFRKFLQCLSSAMHLFSSFVCHATEAGAARRRTVFVDVGVSSLFVNQFVCSVLRFSEHQTAFLTLCINLKFVVRWRHNFGGNLQKFRKFLKKSRGKVCANDFDHLQTAYKYISTRSL